MKHQTGRNVLERVKRVHLVGIGGIGMSGIAELLTNLEYDVSGSDLRRSPITEHLRARGIRVATGHDAAHVGDAELVVVSSAVPAENPELVEAKRRSIRVVPRGMMLAELAGLKRGIAVVGSHGKTTTTAMIALVLADVGLDPTAIIGGRLSAFGSNARLGNGRFMVVEADESDHSFLHLSPEIAVLTNLDDEHLEAYGGMDDLERAFGEFTKRVAERGCVVGCSDDPRIRRVVSTLNRPVLTYGADDRAAAVRAHQTALGSTGSRCRVTITAGGQASDDVELQLGVPGRHNVLNALAAVAVSVQLGVSLPATAAALSRFTGVDRRFQVHGEVAGVLVVDDYGHHPTEITAVLETVRLRAPRRVLVVFQPHRYTRTLRLLDRFGEALATADELILTEIYPASEAPIPGATAKAIAEAVRRVSAIPILVVKSLDQAASIAAARARPGDAIVMLGAGSIDEVAPKVVEALGEQVS